MISIRKYLDLRREAGAESKDEILDLVNRLIEAVERNSSKRHDESPPEETGRQESSTFDGALLARLQERLERAEQACTQCHDRTAERMEQRQAELQTAVRSQKAALTSIASTSTAGIHRLRQLKGEIPLSIDVRAVRNLKNKLSGCLDGVIAEAERQRDVADVAAGHVASSGGHGSGKPDSGQQTCVVDPVTGLPNRVEGETAIAHACQNEDPAYVLIAAINGSGNIEGGLRDLVLQYAAAFLFQQVSPADQVYRWTGPALAVLVRRTKTLSAVRREIEIMLGQRLSVKVPGSDVRVPILLRWTLLPLVASPRLLFHQMDSFVG